MASLTETAFYTRRSVNWLILAIIGYIILRITWGIFVVVYLAIFPPKPPEPTHAFGKLPALKFPTTQASASAQLVFRLDTITGNLPAASESALVYFMPKNPANLLALANAQDLAGKFSFDQTPIQESKNIYRFTDLTVPYRNLRYDINSNNFILRYAFEQDQSVFAQKDVPTQDAALSEATSILQTYDMYKNDIAEGTNKVSYLRIGRGALVPTTSLSQSDAVRVDFFRKDVAATKVVTPFPGQGLISLIFSGSHDEGKRILQFSYAYWPIDYDTSATYPMKTANQAWLDLQAGNGYIAQFPNSGKNAVVRNAYLAYYDTFEPQMYLQPIFVFEGDDGFLAYVPAVSGEWMEN